LFPCAFLVSCACGAFRPAAHEARGAVPRRRGSDRRSRGREGNAPQRAHGVYTFCKQQWGAGLQPVYSSPHRNFSRLQCFIKVNQVKGNLDNRFHLCECFLLNVCSSWEVLLNFTTDEIDATLELINAIHAILDANPIRNPPGGFQARENGIVVVQTLADFPMGEAARVPDGIIFLIPQILDGAIKKRPVGCVHRDDAVFYDI
jgi:hypothetical protein